MRLARCYFVVAWLTVFTLAAIAVHKLGLGGVAVFFTDYSHPWRAQFNTDFTVHVLLIAAWVIYREKASVAGVLWGLGVALCGGLVTFIYLSVASLAADGDMRRLLLGRNYDAA